MRDPIPIITVIVSLILAQPCLGRASDARAEAGELEDLLVSLRMAYEANRAALPFGTIRLRQTLATATDPDAAIRGDRNVKGVADVLYVYDGDRAKYECLYPLETMAARRVKRGDGWSTTVTSIRCSTDGQQTLRDEVWVNSKGDALTHTAQIDKGTDAISTEVRGNIPLSLGNHDPTNDGLNDIISRALENPSMTVERTPGYVDLDGRRALHLRIALGGSARDLWIDVERGAIPLRIRDTRDGEVVGELRNEDIRQVGEGGWLPYRRTSAKRKIVRSQEIVSADFKQRPRASDFDIEFPEPTSMLNLATMTSYAPRDVWNLAKLPGRGSSGSRPLVLSEPPSPGLEMPGEREPRPFWVIPAIVLGLLLMAIAGFLYARRRRHAR